jgi:hypothetical protein
MGVRCWFLAVAILAGGSLKAGPCAPDTLFNYMSLGATGCTVGEYTANNFGFTPLGASGGALPLAANQINVTPTVSGKISLNFASSGFVVTGAQSVQYLIGYTLDPSDPIQSMDDVMDPPSAVIGFAKVTTADCLGAAWTAGPTCSTGNTVTLNVFDSNGATQFTDSKTFAPVFILGVRNTIDLEAMNGSASFDSFGNTSTVPELPTWGYCAAGLILLAALKPAKFASSVLRSSGFPRLGLTGGSSAIACRSTACALSKSALMA